MNKNMREYIHGLLQKSLDVVHCNEGGRRRGDHDDGEIAARLAGLHLTIWHGSGGDRWRRAWLVCLPHLFQLFSVNIFDIGKVLYNNQ